MRVVAYLRVSTDRQAEVGLGLDVQEQAIKRWAKANGHRLVGWCRDEGVSGSNGLETREGLPDALDMIRSGQASGIVVYRLDRLARDLIVQETLLAEVRRLEAVTFSTSKGEDDYLTDDPDDPSRKLIRQVLGAVAEYERSMINLRLRSGRKRKAERGGFAYGSPSYGYRAQNGELVPDDSEQAALTRIRLLHGEGKSLRQIAAQLESEGVAPKRPGSQWHPETLRRLLARFDEQAERRTGQEVASSS